MMADVDQLKEEICDIGRRIYDKGFAAANDGNITARVSENEFLCTPTMQCKGFLKPGDIALVDSQGNQLAGDKPRSSEVLLHLEIYRQRPSLKSVVHCHPPHAVAFGIAREPIPQCVLPEVEVFLGEVPISRYETPGSQAFADTIIPFVNDANVIILANHGTVSFGESVERAYWWTEILDAYCRMLILAKSLGHVTYVSEEKEQELMALKEKWGFDDPRLHEPAGECDLCSNPSFRDTWEAAGVARRAFPAPPPMGAHASQPAPESTLSTNVVRADDSCGAASSETKIPEGVDLEGLVQSITRQVLAELRAKG